MGRAPHKVHVCVEFTRSFARPGDSLRQHLQGQSLELAPAAENFRSTSVAAAGPGRGNLVLNARDAMPSGGTISISTHATAERPQARGAEVLLEIRDTGLGMNEATLARIFEPFFTTKSVQQGRAWDCPWSR